jgi:hypothetical protein
MYSLKASVDQAPGPRSQVDRDLIEISTKCSKTAAKLLAELQTLQLDSEGAVVRPSARLSEQFEEKNM